MARRARAAALLLLALLGAGQVAAQEQLVTDVEPCEDGWRYIRARDRLPVNGTACRFEYTLEYRQADSATLYTPVVNGEAPP